MANVSAAEPVRYSMDRSGWRFRSFAAPSVIWRTPPTQSQNAMRKRLGAEPELLPKCMLAQLRLSSSVVSHL